MRAFRLTLAGTAPLLMHNGRLANPLDPAAQALKKLTGKRNKTQTDYNDLARVEFLGGLYLDPDIGPHLPGDNIWRALQDAAKKERKGRAVAEGLLITSDVNPLSYRGPRTADELWDDENFRHMTTVRIKTERTVRCRPIFRDWRCDAEGLLDENILELDDLARIADTAGQRIGVGDWRPRYGRFTATVEPI